MFKVCFIAPIFLSVKLFAQDEHVLLRKKIDSTIRQLEKADGATERFRWKLGYYEYKIVDSFIVRIIHSYKAGPTQVTKKFYCRDNGGLIFSSEWEITYYGEDSVTWAGSYYFDKMKLLYYETLGHGKSETEEWNPEVEALKNYDEALTVVRNHLMKKKGIE